MTPRDPALRPEASAAGLRSGALWIAIFAVAILLTQLGSLRQEVIGLDESTFILMASNVLDGHLPYVELFDNKPPLMFLMLAGWMGLFGENVAAVRLFGDACLLVICSMIFVISRRWVDPVSAGLGVLLFIAFTATPVPDRALIEEPYTAILFVGQHTGTELPALAMLMTALWLLLAKRQSLPALAAVGMLISLATLTRTNLAVVALAFGAYLLVAGLFLPSSRVPRWGVVAYSAAGLAPLALLALIYWQAGALTEFRLGMFEVALSYAGEQSAGPVHALIRHAELWVWATRVTPFLYVPFTLLTLAGMIVSLRRVRPPAARIHDEVVLWLMLAAILLSIGVGGPAYIYYWLQMTPLFGVFCARALGFRPTSALRLAGAAIVAFCLGTALIRTAGPVFRMMADPHGFDDRYAVRQAARAIAAERRPGDGVWPLEKHLILWYLDLPPPTRIALHPDNIVRPAILAPLVAAGYAAADEAGRVLASRPTYLVRAAGGFPEFTRNIEGFEEIVAAEYDVFFEQDDVVVLRHRDP